MFMSVFYWGVKLIKVHFISILMFGISSNLDNLIVGLSYGIRRKTIGRTADLLVALISFIGTILSIALGKSLLSVFPRRLTAVLGSLIIVAIGVAGLIRYHKGKDLPADPETGLHTLSIHEALVLGLVLSVNNVGLGVGAGMTGLVILPTALFSFAFSLVFLYTGNRLGAARLSNTAGRLAEPAASCLMIALGIYEMFV